MPQTNPPDPDSSLYAWLAHDLRFYRKKYGLTLEKLGKIIGRSESGLSNCEAGRRTITEDEAKVLDKIWDTGGHFRRLLLFARLAHDPDWFREHVSYEAKAKILRIFETMYVPGLLQTPEYARAALEVDGPEAHQAALDARLSRQEILQRSNPPLLWVILDQAVLCRPVGGSETMRAQLAHLIRMSELPNIAVRVVPWAAGGYIGQDGPFKILTSDREVAYADAPTGGRLIMDSTEVREFGVRYDKIGLKALPEDLSRRLIREAMEAI
ncbi:helix-turn-helix transcriptional regulator [Actinomadura sp. KC06]|uniref:helix-turn-helix domain-containing protein n=1 Tax=Actinomadura sp. KC06 TaxID=2530369 RepID=UPI001FB73932|nr:helix-turn-helix transcriptional regulator [Actinomadura sp. KC06]